MQVIADLHIHSKYSRAVSPQMTIPFIWEWAKRKGITLMTTGDWTHPLWIREIKQNLEETGMGLLKIKDQSSKIKDEWGENIKANSIDPLFLLTTEISSIYSQGGRLRRIHNLIWSPSIATADQINKELLSRGANLSSDGRPIVGLTSIQIAELVLSIDPSCLIVPCHIWTPWFSLYGSESGFDSIDECFGSYAKYIYAVETGLSSDPAMNWRIKELDSRSIVSSSDAHSGPKLGREATVFELAELSYKAICEAIINRGESVNANKIAYTIEFHPEEGKYHWTGHRNCGIKQTPEETKKKGVVCPVCGKKLTIGVMHRVEQLAKRSEEELKLSVVNKQLSEGKNSIKITESSTQPSRPPYVMLVPLQEILSEALGGMPTGQVVQNEYKKLTDGFGGEFEVLLNIDINKIKNISGERVGEAIEKVRNNDMTVDPGYDGVFGKVKIWKAVDKEEKKDTKEQMSLF